jgi:hypothetical protein
MKYSLNRVLLLCTYFVIAIGSAFCAETATGALTCVGLYSETSDGYVSVRISSSASWTPIKVGDAIPAGAQIKINVDRDWVEFVATGKPTIVYEIAGPESGETVLKVADVLKGKSRTVAFPKGSASVPDPKFKDMLVVTRYLGRQIYKNTNGDSKDIKYGDVFTRGGKVRIIATNNTVDLMNASGASTTVIGPLNFTVDQVLDNKSLYKYLNVQ